MSLVPNLKSKVRKTETWYITPAMAREIAARCPFNPRKPGVKDFIHPSHLEALSAAFARGEWRHTHVGIAFDQDGNMIDGHHRVRGFGRQRDGMVFAVEVTLGLNREEVAMFIDAMSAPRNLSETLGIGSRLAEVALFMARIHMGRTIVSPCYAQPFVAWTKPRHDTLVDYCNTSTKTWSSAPVRAAAVLTMARAVPAKYVLEVYRSLVQGDFDTMPTVAKALFRSQMNGAVVRSNRAYDVFCRALKVFDPAKAADKKIQINATAAMIAEARAFLQACVVVPEEVVPEPPPAVEPEPEKNPPPAKSTPARKYPPTPGLEAA
jgi:hypothetical protein